jgi:hypothetical protein
MLHEVSMEKSGKMASFEIFEDSSLSKLIQTHVAKKLGRVGSVNKQKCAC